MIPAVSSFGTPNILCMPKCMLRQSGLFSLQPSLTCIGHAKNEPGAARAGASRPLKSPARSMTDQQQLACMAAAVDTAGPDTAEVDVQDLLSAAQKAAEAGAEVVREALDKPKNITFKGTTDLVTDTDKASEKAVLGCLKDLFPEHMILGEEGGVAGNSASKFLWCVDPLDGTTNFSHAYPSFGVSVAVVSGGQPLAACVVEFTGGPHAWTTKTYTAGKGLGAFCNGEKLAVSQTGNLTHSLLVTGFGYEHDDAWSSNIELFKYFTDKTQGVRRLGAAAIDLCHVALGVSDGFWEYRLKPWDMAAGILMVKEAGGQVTNMEGGPYSVFSRSVLATNGLLHQDILAETEPKTKKLRNNGFDMDPWFIPSRYKFEEE